MSGEQVVPSHGKEKFYNIDTSDPLPEPNREAFNDVNVFSKFGGGIFNKLEIVMNNPTGCEKYPHDEMDEHCKFKIVNQLFTKPKGV